MVSMQYVRYHTSNTRRVLKFKSINKFSEPYKIEKNYMHFSLDAEKDP